MGFNIGIIASSILKDSIIYDDDAKSFINNASINSLAQKQAVNNLVIALKTQNLWSKLISFSPKVGGTADAHKFNLKDPRDLNVAYRYTYTGGWTHSSKGAKASGTNTFANTYCNLSTLGLAGNFSFGYYLTVANGQFGDRHGMGGYSSANNFVSTQHNSATQLLAMGYGGGGLALTIASPNNGFFAISVNGTVKKAYHKNLIGTGTTNGTTVPTVNLYEGALNFNNAYYSGLSATFGSSFIAPCLTDTEIANLQSIIITFETALGRNV